MNTAADSRVTMFRRAVPGVVLLFALAHLAHHLVTALPVPLLPFIRDEFNLDYTRAALVVSAPVPASPNMASSKASASKCRRPRRTTSALPGSEM